MSQVNHRQNKENKMRMGIIGCGHMGTALTENLVKSLGAERISVFDKDTQKQDSLAKGFHVRGAKTTQEFLDSSDIIIIAVKPQDIEGVLGILKGRSDKLIVSIAAGMTLQYLSEKMGTDVPVVRAMPNLNAMVSASATGISFGANVNQAQKELTKKIFESIGSVIVLKEEYMNAFTAMAGSGPAFVAYLMQDLPMETIRQVFVQEALAFGFDQGISQAIVNQTIAGTQKILKVNFDRDIFIKKVCSKGGTTEAGLKVLEEKGKTKEALSEAIRAACRRAAELARR